MSGINSSSDLLEAMLETAQNLGEHTLESAGHQAADYVIDEISKNGLDCLDLDHDGSISDTIPDLAQSAFYFVSGLFG